MLFLPQVVGSTEISQSNNPIVFGAYKLGISHHKCWTDSMKAAPLFCMLGLLAQTVGAPGCTTAVHRYPARAGK